MTDEPNAADLFEVFLRDLETARRVTIVDEGHSTASHLHGPSLLDAWSRRADLKPRVKKLEWAEDCFNDTKWVARAMGREYHVGSENIGEFFCWDDVASVDIVSAAPSADLAKAAAQADFERRVLECLEDM